MRKRAYTCLALSRLSVGVLLLSIVCVLIALVYSPFSFAIVGSSSMSPSLSKGDVLLWEVADITDIAVGDIVVYRNPISWSGEKIIVHRVVEITTSHKGEVILATRGDATTQSNQQESMLSELYVGSDQVLGKVVCIGEQPVKIPFMGMIGLLTK